MFPYWTLRYRVKKYLFCSLQGTHNLMGNTKHDDNDSKSKVKQLPKTMQSSMTDMLSEHSIGAFKS